MFDFDKQCSRVKAVFGSEEIPEVTEANIGVYLKWLKSKLTCPCLLIDRDAYISRDELCFFCNSHPGDERIKIDRVPPREKYELQGLDDAKFEGQWDIVVPVVRVSNKKQFIIPLSYLMVVDHRSENNRLLNDYSVWHANWRYWNIDEF